jgi:heterodisulfide reductase subunit C/nitrate reductase gamma subunit
LQEDLPMSFFSISLYLALAIFAVGMVYKISIWFTRKVGVLGRQFTPLQRLRAAIVGILGVIFSAKVVVIVRTFILDVLLQMRIAREDRLRWIMHLLIFVGFVFLFLMHAMEKHITARLFAEYYSTLNPFFFLRNLFGLMVVAGVAIAFYRRFILKVPRMMNNRMDRITIAIVAVIILSGFLLEGTKMSSYTEFTYMAEDYAGLAEGDEEFEALESYWVAEYGTVSPNVQGPFDAEVLAMGREVHMNSCVECHAPNKSAFVGYAAAKAISPVALALDRFNGVSVLWHVHFIACFLGLAYLPFSKMLHIFSSPLILLANAVMDPKTSLPANIATRQALELDACTHCGTCSLHCSSSVAYEAKGNQMILPAEKLAFLKQFASGRTLSQDSLDALKEGVYLCTNCDRCTVVCPVGINLRELWLSARESVLAGSGAVLLTLSPFSFYRGLNRLRLPADSYDRPMDAAMDVLAASFPMVRKTEDPIPVTPIDTTFKDLTRESAGATFAHCFACENCTTVCPVVQAYDNPQEAVGLLPHQIMRSLGLGIRDLALGAPMLWSCLTCYQCQEHCPQGVKVTDVLYELKNQAVREVAAGS